MPGGGARPGAGRPNMGVRATRANTRIAQNLKEIVNVELEEAALSYRELVQKGIELAKAGNVAMLKLFIELPFKSLDFTEVPDNNLDAVREMLTHMKDSPIPDGTSAQRTD